jgi:N-methylhydantoinase A
MLDEAAFGITEMVDENMANAARVHTVENGRDIAQFTMVAFGGGAPLHACRLCEKLGLRRGTDPARRGRRLRHRVPASAGQLRGDARALSDGSTCLRPTGRERDAGRPVRGRQCAFVDRGAGDAARATRLIAQMRYVGQGWEIPVTLPHRAFSDTDIPMIVAAFEVAYRTLFGRVIEGLVIEVTNWQLTVATEVPPMPDAQRFDSGTPTPPARTRQFYDAALRKTVDAAEVHRSVMTPGARIDGPAIIVEDETATIVTSAFCAVGQGDGSLRLIRKEAMP